jgi:hypothetical protein
MNVLWSRLFRSVYRKQPMVGFVATIGGVDAAMGGLSQHWSLLVLGLGTVGVAIVLYYLQRQRRRPLEVATPSSAYILPPQSSRPSLPPLDSRKPNSFGRF